MPTDEEIVAPFILSETQLQKLPGNAREKARRGMEAAVKNFQAVIKLARADSLDNIITKLEEYKNSKPEGDMDEIIGIVKAEFTRVSA